MAHHLYYSLLWCLHNKIDSIWQIYLQILSLTTTSYLMITKNALFYFESSIHLKICQKLLENQALALLIVDLQAFRHRQYFWSTLEIKPSFCLLFYLVWVGYHILYRKLFFEWNYSLSEGFWWRFKGLVSCPYACTLWYGYIDL